MEYAHTFMIIAVVVGSVFLGRWMERRSWCVRIKGSPTRSHQITYGKQRFYLVDQTRHEDTRRLRQCNQKLRGQLDLAIRQFEGEQ